MATPSNIGNTSSTSTNSALKDQTLQNFITDDGHHPERVDTMIELARRSVKWRGELKFYKTNITGSIKTMSSETFRRCERMKKELLDQEIKDSLE